MKSWGRVEECEAGESWESSNRRAYPRFDITLGSSMKKAKTTHQFSPENISPVPAREAVVTPAPTTPSVICYMFRSMLKEYAQKAGFETPVYETTKEGPPHERLFRSTVLVNGVRYDSLPGFSSRKPSQQSAAEVALSQLSHSADMKPWITVPMNETGLWKNLLQEYAQKLNYAVPLYDCSRTASKEIMYSCTVDVGGTKYIGAPANARKEAEITAARLALLGIQSVACEDPAGKNSSDLGMSTPDTKYINIVVPQRKKSSDLWMSTPDTVAALKPKMDGEQTWPKWEETGSVSSEQTKSGKLNMEATINDSNTGVFDKILEKSLIPLDGGDCENSGDVKVLDQADALVVDMDWEELGVTQIVTLHEKATDVSEEFSAANILSCQGTDSEVRHMETIPNNCSSGFNKGLEENALTVSNEGLHKETLDIQADVFRSQHDMTGDVMVGEAELESRELDSVINVVSCQGIDNANDLVSLNEGVLIDESDINMFDPPTFDTTSGPSRNKKKRKKAKITRQFSPENNAPVTEPAPAPAPVLIPKPTTPSVSSCYIFKSRLQEYAQRAGLETPVYETTKEGPPHEPIFSSSVILNDVRYDSLRGFFNRKASEQSAAEVALSQLSHSVGMKFGIVVPVSETGLSKNLLQEYAQKMNYAAPLYDCSRTASKKIMYSCTVDVGGTKYIGAPASAKKEAEIKAARVALLAIQSATSENPAGKSVHVVIPQKKKSFDLGINTPDTLAAPKPKPNNKLRKRKYNNKRGKKAAGELEVKIDGEQTGAELVETVDVNFEQTNSGKLNIEATINDSNTGVFDELLVPLNGGHSESGGLDSVINVVSCQGVDNVNDLVSSNEGVLIDESDINMFDREGGLNTFTAANNKGIDGSAPDKQNGVPNNCREGFDGAGASTNKIKILWHSSTCTSQNDIANGLMARGAGLESGKAIDDKGIEENAFDGSAPDKQNGVPNNCREGFDGAGASTNKIKILWHPSTCTSQNDIANGLMARGAGLESGKAIDDKGIEENALAVTNEGLRTNMLDIETDGVAKNPKMKNRSQPSTKKPSTALSIDKWSAQCGECLKWRVIHSQEEYEEIRARFTEEPFVCSKKLYTCCDDPADIEYDISRTWVIDKPHLPKTPSGFKRQIKVRKNFAKTDCYYITPNGKLIRSAIELATFLDENPEYKKYVNNSDFSFSRPKIMQDTIPPAKW